MRRCGCRRKRGLRMSGRGCVAAGGIGLSEGYDPAAVNRWVAVNRHSLLAPPLTHGGAFSCEVAGTEIHKNFLGNGTLPC